MCKTFKTATLEPSTYSNDAKYLNQKTPFVCDSILTCLFLSEQNTEVSRRSLCHRSTFHIVEGISLIKI